MSLRARWPVAAAVAFLLAVTGVVGGTLWHSHSTGSSAAAGSSTGVDFANDQAANYAAAQGNLSNDLERFDTYALAQIVSSGIEVDLVGPPTAAIRAVVAQDDPQYQGKPIPVSYRSVRHTRRELQALVDRISGDRDSLKQQGIELTSWGWGASNVVEISLVHYTKAYQDVLLDRYGSDWVSVVPHDVSTGF
jgi:hypothetical protein